MSTECPAQNAHGVVHDGQWMPWEGDYHDSSSYELWLMAKPQDGIYVPIAYYNWYFSLDVHVDWNNTVPNKWYYEMLAGDHGPNGASRDTFVYPEWDTDHQ